MKNVKSEPKKSGSGGARPGAGRPRGKSRRVQMSIYPEPGTAKKLMNISKKRKKTLGQVIDTLVRAS